MYLALAASEELTISSEGFCSRLCSRLVQQRRERWIFDMTSLKAMVPLRNAGVEVVEKYAVSRERM